MSPCETLRIVNKPGAADVSACQGRKVSRSNKLDMQLVRLTMTPAVSDSASALGSEDELALALPTMWR